MPSPFPSGLATTQSFQHWISVKLVTAVPDQACLTLVGAVRQAATSAAAVGSAQDVLAGEAIPVSDLNAKAVTDPVASVRVDVGVVKNGLPTGIFVSGPVYDVATGLVEAIVPPARVTP